MKDKAILLLDDGTVIHGTAFGAKGIATGELCFNTGMTGYQEVFTDPSYFGQVLIMNTVHTGDYGVRPQDVESGSIKVQAVIGKNLESKFSRFMANTSLQEYFEAENLVAIHEVDTRALVAYVRTKGAMNCIVSSTEMDIEILKEKLAAAPKMDGLALATYVSTEQPYSLGDENSELRVAVLDLGIKKNILNCLVERGVNVKVFPAKTTYAEMEKFAPQGYFVSNGPGDPAPLDFAITTMKQILENNKPMFGICLGHQLLALANGIGTYKMHHGHRGLNHPVKNMISGRSEITTQNHGFGIKAEEVKDHAEIEVTHVNLNDDSIEGIRMKNKKAFSVQYHPEATPGPHDSRYLFDEFVAMLQN